MLASLGRLFYLGDRFHGSQWQPGLPTVQGELIDALTQWSGTDHSVETVQLSGRTDRGVHCLGQIVLVKDDMLIDVDKINRYLPDDVALWVSAPAPDNFMPRYSILSRHYRYFLDSSDITLDLIRMSEAAQLLIGTHDFTLLSKPDRDRGSIATLLNVSLRSAGDTLLIDFIGTSFLWKLVRKAVTLLTRIGTGEMNHEALLDLLAGTKSIPGGITPAPSESLVLLESNIPIRLERSRYALQRIRNTLETRSSFLRRSLTTLSYLFDYPFD